MYPGPAHAHWQGHNLNHNLSELKISLLSVLIRFKLPSSDAAGAQLLHPDCAVVTARR
jgi:hypothetical protein